MLTPGCFKLGVDPIARRTSLYEALAAKLGLLPYWLLLLGGLIDTTLLGVYMIAYSIFNSVEQLLSKIINDVSFSALSEVVRERPANLKASYYRLHAP